MVSNFYGESVDFALPEGISQGRGELLISNYEGSPSRPQSCRLRPYESLMWLIKE